jgi:hypothetical protein
VGLVVACRRVGSEEGSLLRFDGRSVVGRRPFIRVEPRARDASEPLPEQAPLLCRERAGLRLLIVSRGQAPVSSVSHRPFEIPLLYDVATIQVGLTCCNGLLLLLRGH